MGDSRSVVKCKIPSETKEGVSYTLSVRDGKLHCSCPGFLFTGNCKHVKKVKEMKRAYENRKKEIGK